MLVATKKFPSSIDIFAIIIYEWHGQSQEYKQFANTQLMHKLGLIIVTFMNWPNFFLSYKKWFQMLEQKVKLGG
jgi:hypothetical protein